MPEVLSNVSVLEELVIHNKSTMEPTDSPDELKSDDHDIRDSCEETTCSDRLNPNIQMNFPVCSGFKVHMAGPCVVSEQLDTRAGPGSTHIGSLHSGNETLASGTPIKLHPPVSYTHLTLPTILLV